MHSPRTSTDNQVLILMGMGLPLQICLGLTQLPPPTFQANLPSADQGPVTKT